MYVVLKDNSMYLLLYIIPIIPWFFLGVKGTITGEYENTYMFHYLM